jgi:hypothetical protein
VVELQHQHVLALQQVALLAKQRRFSGESRAQFRFQRIKLRMRAPGAPDHGQPEGSELALLRGCGVTHCVHSEFVDLGLQSERLGVAPGNALCVIPSFTVASHRKPGWSKVLTMKMNEKTANAPKLNENHRSPGLGSAQLSLATAAHENVIMTIWR